MGIRRQVDVIETARVQSPALFGLVRPRLLIPPGFLRAFTETELRHVLLHELAHLRRGDLWLNWWMVWIQAVHWFNPLVWLLLARIRSDRELACDALAMTRTAESDRATYGQTVLKLLERLSAPSPVPGSVGVLEDGRAIERRVQSIIRFRPRQRRPWVVVGLWIALAGLTLTDGRSVAIEAEATRSEQRSPNARYRDIAEDAVQRQKAQENDPHTIAEPIRQQEEREIQGNNTPDGDVSIGEDSTDKLSPSEAAEPDLGSPFQMRLGYSVRYSHQFSPPYRAPRGQPATNRIDQATVADPLPSGGVMIALLTPEELGQGWSWRIDVLIDPASQPAELLRGSGQLKERVRETVRTGSAVGVASVRYADPDRTGFEVWAYRFADSATARRARRALLAGDIQPSSRVIEGMEAMVFEGRAHQGPTLWLHHETFAVAIAVKPPSFPDSLMSVVSQFALHLRRIAEPNSRRDAAPR